MPVVQFVSANRSVQVEVGASLLDAAAQAGITVHAPCGGEGTCGQCRVKIATGTVESVQRGCLTAEEIAQGIVLACSSRVKEDISVVTVEDEAVANAKIVTDAAGAHAGALNESPQPLAQKKCLKTSPPSEDDVLSDWERLALTIRKTGEYEVIAPRLGVLRCLAETLRARDYETTVTLVPNSESGATEIIRVQSGDTSGCQFGLAIDVGTTTCAIRLIDLITGHIIGTAADYNGQLSRGADVISRINYARQPQRAEELRRLVLNTLNALVASLCGQHSVNHEDIDNVVMVGNTTMIHLLLGFPPEYLRLAPYTPTVNRTPMLSAREVGLKVYPEARVVFAPGVGSYVGGDITAGLLPSALAGDSHAVRLFLDFGTNGEVVVGNCEWLMACAASAGPAFEGAGVSCGMRAMTGAIESVRIDPVTRQPKISVIGGGKPAGICGSGLVDLLAELMLAGIVDSSGKLNASKDSERIRPASDTGRNLAYTVVNADDSRTNKPITIDESDIANLLRTKAAVYSACAVMLKSVGLDFDAVEEVYVAGGFGRYLNIERSIAIGLLPDLPRERFTYLGNSALTGAHAMLCDTGARQKVNELADRITYLNLNVDPAYMSEYTAALFLPHTDIDRFPSVKQSRT